FARSLLENLLHFRRTELLRDVSAARRKGLYDRALCFRPPPSREEAEEPAQRIFAVAARNMGVSFAHLCLHEAVEDLPSANTKRLALQLRLHHRRLPPPGKFADAELRFGQIEHIMICLVDSVMELGVAERRQAQTPCRSRQLVADGSKGGESV